MMNTKEYRASLAKTFINVLQEKQLDWKKGWNGWEKNTPMNGETKYKYKGINRFHLTIISMLRGYEDPRWCTYTQIQKEGWKLVDAKGQGVKVEYWFPYDTEEKRGLSWKEFRELDEPLGERYTLRAVYKTVFNATLIEGIPPFPEPEQYDVTPDILVDTLSKNMGVPIINDGKDRAFYRHSEDAIHLPLPEFFYSDYEYASTALHELAHATGAVHRLNRNMGRRGSEEYAFEELVAEISSCFMSVNLQVEQTKEHVDNHKAYVQAWVQAIQNTPEILVKAVQEAEKAASYMEYKAGVIKQEEYEMVSGSSEEVSLVKTDVLNSLLWKRDRDHTYHSLKHAFEMISMKAVTDMIGNNTEWGSWMGRSVNTERPQDYIDIDITGYSTWHEVTYTVLIVHANEIVESKNFSIKTDIEQFEQSVREGNRKATAYFQEYFKEAVDKLDTAFEAPMKIYSTFTEDPLDEHHEILERNGYERMPGYKGSTIDKENAEGEPNHAREQEAEKEQSKEQKKVIKPTLHM